MEKRLVSIGLFIGSSFVPRIWAFCRPQISRSLSSLSNDLETKAPTDIALLRKEYSDDSIDDDNIEKDPLSFFSKWLNEACEVKVIEPNAMCLSTCKDNRPTSRFVLLKGVDKQGFKWYSNYGSRKGNEIDANPFGALTFWWGPLERSVRIEGTISKLSTEESDAYFRVRPRGAQVGAWSSAQSRTIESREMLELQEIAIKMRFQDESIEVPRPPHWGGFRLVPDRIEFWKGRSCRLHDRIVYEKVDTMPDGEMIWKISRLQP